MPTGYLCNKATNHFALKYKLIMAANRAAMNELQNLYNGLRAA